MKNCSIILIILSLCLVLIIRSQESESNSNSAILLLGDFNGDGKSDYLVQKTGGWANNLENTVEIFLSLINNIFQQLDLTPRYDLWSNNINLYIGDFNGDGQADIFRQEKGDWAADNTNTATILLSNSPGDFTRTVLPESFQLNGDLANVYIGDFNGDGLDDILRQTKESETDNGAILFLSILSPQFDMSMIPTPDNFNFPIVGEYINIYIGDFNGDGRDDILRQEKGAWGADNANTASILFYRDDNSFDNLTLPEDFYLNGDYTLLKIGDFNGDGRDDILRLEKGIWADHKSNNVQILFPDGQGRFDQIILPEEYNITAENSKVYIGDFNGDGKEDFFRQNIGELPSNTSTFELFYSNGQTFERLEVNDPELDTQDNSTEFYVGDFNGDGVMDLLRYQVTNGVFIYVGTKSNEVD